MKVIPDRPLPHPNPPPIPSCFPELQRLLLSFSSLEAPPWFRQLLCLPSAFGIASLRLRRDSGSGSLPHPPPDPPLPDTITRLPPRMRRERERRAAFFNCSPLVHVRGLLHIHQLPLLIWRRVWRGPQPADLFHYFMAASAGGGGEEGGVGFCHGIDRAHLWKRCSDGG